MSEHFLAVNNLAINGKASDTFAAHFAEHYPNGCPAQFLRENIDFEVLQQCNPISCVRSFKTLSCQLCAKERLAILRASMNSSVQLINKSSEIYGACRHNPRFHRFPSTDDPNKGEKVKPCFEITEGLINQRIWLNKQPNNGWNLNFNLSFTVGNGQTEEV